MSRKHLYLLGSFIGIAVIVHLLYIGHIRPQAQQVIDAARDAGEATPRTLYVVLKDPEQEICIILALFCGVLLAGKGLRIHSQRYLFTVDLLEPEAGSEPNHLQTLEKLPAEVVDSPLVKTLIASVRRFAATNDVQHAAEVIDSNIESTGMKLESENSLIRYLIWSIPSIGFVGTVRGIGVALAEADKALDGDIASMTESLGIAFNSTMVALILSILLTAGLHLLQRLQDQLILGIEDYCDKFLVKRLATELSRVQA